MGAEIASAADRAGGFHGIAWRSRCGGRSRDSLHQRCGLQLAGDAQAKIAALNLDFRQIGFAQDIGELAHDFRVDRRTASGLRTHDVAFCIRQ